MNVGPAATLRAGRIGPNAITRVAEVLPGQVGSTTTLELFNAAGLADALRHPPQQMVDEADVRRLHRALHDRLGPAAAARVGDEAGRRTGDYLLAHRIPGPMQGLLRHLPAALAARVLLAAIARHAWTFAGSGQFEARAGRPVVLALRHNPLVRGLHAEAPACRYHAATFEHLFRALVAADAVVEEVACEACGADACRFEVHWSRHSRAPGRCRHGP